jgi:hypothetical protein
MAEMQGTAGQMAKRFGILMGLVATPMWMAGCAAWEKQWQEDLQRSAARQSSRAVAEGGVGSAGVGSGGEASGNSGVEMGEGVDPGREASVVEAREQVLSFINRLESTADSDAGAGDESAANSDGGAGRGMDSKSPSESGRRAGASDRRRESGFREYDGVAALSGDPSGRASNEDGDAGSESSVIAATGSLSIEGSAKAPRVISVALRATPGSLRESNIDEDLKAVGDGFVGSDDGVNQPVGSGRRGDSGTDGGALLRAMEARAESAPADALTHWRLGLLRAALGETLLATEVSEAVGAERSALAREGLEAVVALERAVGDPVSHSDAAVEALEEASAALRASATLSIPALKMCTKVMGFGVYDELDASAFRAHAANQAIVYLEVDRFVSERAADGRFRTLLADRFEILTAEGDSVWSHEEPSIEDRAHRRRRDFFVAQRIVMPASMGAGDYVLKVTVEDLLAEKRAQRILPFTIQGGDSAKGLGRRTSLNR